MNKGIQALAGIGKRGIRMIGKLFKGIMKLPYAVRCVLLGAVACAVFMSGFGMSSAISSKTTQLGFKDIGELATQAGYYTSVQVIDEAQKLWDWKVPGTNSKYIFSYDGVLKAGVDFGEIEVDVSDIARKITVKFPEFKILSNEIDEKSLMIYDARQSIFTPLSIESMNESLAKLKEESEKTAIGNGLLEEARSNAEMLIMGFVAGKYDLDKYTIIFE